MKVSVGIITFNEEENLERCLKSCADLAAEIVVLDSGSTDRTQEIAEKFRARFVHQDWLGYVGQKNLLLTLVKEDWILSLDADEELSPALREEIGNFQGIDVAPEVAAFSVPRCVLYEARWIRHGDWYPDRLPRLFRKGRARFSGGKVHERLEVQGKTIPLQSELYHHSFRDAADHWARCEKYARLWAESEYERGRKALPFAPLTHAFFRWLRAFFFRRGFLDGRRGWRIAMFSARETFWKYRLLREMNAPRRR